MSCLLNYRCLMVLLACWQVSSLTGATAAEQKTGKQIYLQKCASCHGENGGGTQEHYPDPLIGDRPLGDLARVIESTMPEGAPQECVGDDAALVAAYIYDAFYSPIAQARNEPARIELSRLTVRQFQQSVADLVGSFRPSTPKAPWDYENGLRAQYSKNRRFGKGDLAIERVDAVVDFDFGEASPQPGKIDAEEFAIRWEGGLLVADTGDYELIVDTDSGARLWLNDLQTPLIDAWVQSGGRQQHVGSIRLIGGRVYPLKLEIFKSKKAKQKTAAVRLLWKAPEQARQILPSRHLLAGRYAPVMVVETAFPPDDRSMGYERGSTISKEWDQANTHAAIEVAGKIAADLRGLASLSDDASKRPEQVRAFCRAFVGRAFRRPLTDAEQALFIERQFAASPDLETAVRRVVMLTLKSPRFLYRENTADGMDRYERASWLSLGLWDSLPDEALLAAAAADQLQTREQIASQARRMLKDPRARYKVREFLHQWLNLDRIHDLSKDELTYPGFNEDVVSDLRTSLDLFLEDAIWGKSGDFRQLLTADTLLLNGRLARFYDVEVAEDAPFEPVGLNPQARAGVLSHPYLMTGFAYRTTTSPIHRGVFVARNVLGRFLKPPQEAVSPLAPDLHPDLTTRQRVGLQTSAAACHACHALINPLGFSLEEFDAVGRYRDLEKGKPIDASGSYLTQGGETVTFSGARELGNFLAASPEVHAAFAERLFQYMLKQPVRAFGDDRLEALGKEFREHHFSVPELLVEIMTQSILATQADSLTKAKLGAATSLDRGQR